MSKKVLVGGWGGVVVCLNIVSSPGLGFVNVRARFSQVGQGFVCQVVDQVSQVKDHVGQGQGYELDSSVTNKQPKGQC